MKKTLLLTIMMLGYMVSQAQINKYGLPFVTNYSSKTYKAHALSYDVQHDKRGIMYFANNDGILEYDGSKWNLIHKLYVMSLSVDDDNIVHVGTSDGFGYLFPNAVGKLEYVSLSDNLPDSIRFSAIERTYSHGSLSYYCSNDYIFVTKRDSIIEIIDLPERGWNSFLRGDTLLISTMENEMIIYHDHEYTNLKNGFRGPVYGMVTLPNNKYMVAGSSFLYEFDFTNNKSSIITNKCVDNLVQTSIPYNLTKFGNEPVLSTVNGENFGSTVFDTAYMPTIVLNKKLGLASSNVSSSNVINHILWMTTGNGISKAELGGQIRCFDERTGLSGEVKDICEYSGNLYVGTSDGLFVKRTDSLGFTYFEKTFRYSVSGLLEFKIPNSNSTMLLMSSSVDIRKVTKTNDAKDKIIGGDITCACQFDSYPDLLFVGTRNDGLMIMRYTSGTWKHVRTIPEINTTISASDDVHGNLWFANFDGVLSRLDMTNYSVREYSEEDGLPSMEQLKVERVDDEVFFYTVKGIYKYDYDKSAFVLADFGTVNNDATHAFWTLCPYGDGFAAINYDEQNNWVSFVEKNDAGEYTNINKLAFNKLPNEWINTLYVDNENSLWIGIDKLYCYRPEFDIFDTPYYQVEYNALIRQVTANDSVVFGGSFKMQNGWGVALCQDKESHVALPFRDNSLTFVYSAPFYDSEDQLVYSTMLEGESQTWSKWKTTTEYSTGHLREGNYVFKVKARNIYGHESSVGEYAFTIKPPFYRTIFAYVIYVLATIAAMFGIVKWNTHRLIEDKKKLERKIAEATEEIRGQNVQLEQQKDEIEKQKDEIQASINYARRIQRALLTPDETIDKVFPDHFLLYKPRNVVSGDYYWIGQFGDNKVCIVADCTGHGVPGGFMSMLGMTNLNYIVGQELHPDEILNKLRNAIITSLRQKDEASEAQIVENAAVSVVTEKKDRSQDGMDVAMYVINEKEMTLSFAGANNPLVLIRDGEVQVIKASKMPVGIYAKLDPFERVDMELKKGDCLYTFSDGFQDQFGQATGRKFMSKHLREVLLENHQKPMAEQKEILNKTYEDWRGPADLQTDDVVLMGVRI